MVMKMTGGPDHEPKSELREETSLELCDPKEPSKSFTLDSLPLRNESVVTCLGCGKH